jgi:hypothetical protein
LENFLQAKEIIASYDAENMANKSASKEIYFSLSVILTLHIATTTIRRLLYIYVEKLNKCLYRILPRWNYLNLLAPEIYIYFK